MKNICFFNSITFWGGGEKLHLENAVEFKKKNYRVIVAANPTSPLWEKANAESLDTFPIRAGNLSFLNPFKLIKLISFYKREKVDTVIFSSSQDLKLGSISAKMAGVQQIVYLRGLAVPIKAKPLNRMIFKSILTHIVSNSEETKRSILTHLGKYISSEKVHTIYHGIDASNHNPEHPSPLKAIQEKGHGVILGNAGRLTAQKGQEHLIPVAKILKDQKIDFTLFIAGTGELEPKLTSLIKKNDLQDHIILLGFVDEMEHFMHSIDVFLLTSQWEGFGFVLVEAMLHSVPVVAFDTSSNPEIVAAGETGFLVENRDVDAFAEKASQLIMDKSLRKKMGEAGRKRVYERFVLKERVEELEAYLRG